MPRLPHTAIDELCFAAVSAGLAREALLSGISPSFCTQLPIMSQPGAQLLSDLHRLNEITELIDNSDPLSIWLSNAHRLAYPRREVITFREHLSALKVALPSDATVTARREGQTWDLCIVHADADKAIADGLYDLLADKCAVFLAHRTIELGDDTDRCSRDAQLASKVTVVVITRSATKAFYSSDVVVQALDLARTNPFRHRLVPLYVQQAPAAPSRKRRASTKRHDPDRLDEVPSRLRLKQSIEISSVKQLAVAANRLETLMQSIRKGCAEHVCSGPQASGTRSYVYISPRKVDVIFNQLTGSWCIFRSTWVSLQPVRLSGARNRRAE